MEARTQKNSALQDTFTRELESVHRALSDYPWENSKAYAVFMAQTYFLVRQTTHLLGLAIARARNRDTHYAMIQHLKEELNHDLVALRDLKELGYTESDFEEFVETRLLLNNQFYWLEYGPATSLMGYALCLEGLATLAGPQLLKRLASAPARGAVAFLDLHVKSDESHFPEGIRFLESLPEDERDAAIANLVQSCLLYKQMIARCHERFETLREPSPKKRAA